MWLPQLYPPGTKLESLNPTQQQELKQKQQNVILQRVQADDNCSNPVPDSEKKDCGFNGINETQCMERNCCWAPIIPNPHNYPYCYWPVLPPPPPPEPGNVTITIDLVDFYNVGPTDSQPAGSFSIVDYGADPTGKKDSSQPIANTITAATKAGQAVWIPAGTFMVIQHISLINNLTIIGAGPWYSILRGGGVGLYGNPSPASSNVYVSGISIVGDTRIRDDDEADTGIGGALSDSIVTNIFITHTKCGMWLDGPFNNFLITGVLIHDTTADGINFHRGITNSVVEHSALRNTGDDILAMWSDSVPDVNNTFRFNTLQVPVLANNLAIYGGSDNKALSNYASDTLCQGGGLHVGNRFSAVPLAGLTILDGNEIHRGGQLDPNWNFGVGAIWFYALDHPMTGNIRVTNNLLFDSPWEAFQFIGSSVTNVVFENITIVNVGSFVFQFQGDGSGIASNIIATGHQYYGQYNCGVQFKLTDGGGNQGWNATHCGWPPNAPNNNNNNIINIRTSQNIHNNRKNHKKQQLGARNRHS